MGICKIKIKECSITCCTQKQKKKKKTRSNKTRRKSNRGKRKQELIDSNYKSSIKLERDTYINHIHDLIEDQKVGAQFRSRGTWTEEGERSQSWVFCFGSLVILDVARCYLWLFTL